MIDLSNFTRGKNEAFILFLVRYDEYFDMILGRFQLSPWLWATIVFFSLFYKIIG